MKTTALRIGIVFAASILFACGGGGGGGGGGIGPVGPADADSDGVADVSDNCPAIANASQDDLDMDNIGDVCDDDADGDGTLNSDDVDKDNDALIEIATLIELDWMRNDLTGASLTDHDGNQMMDGCPNNLCMGYELVSDLDFDTNGDGTLDANDTYFDYDGDGDNNGWFPVGHSFHFATNFEGNNHRISNFYIKRTDTDPQTTGSFIGFFGSIDGSSSALPIEIRNVVFDGDLSEVIGTDTVGLVAAAGAYVTFRNVAASGNVTISNANGGGLVGILGNESAIIDSIASGDVTADNAVGGLVGRVRGVTGANVTIIDSSATGDVIGQHRAGGLVGVVGSFVNMTISGANASGNVTTSSVGLVSGTFGGLVGEARNLSIDNTIASGNVNGGDFTGGMLGFAADNVAISDSSATGSVTGASASSSTGGLIGYASNSTVRTSSASGAIFAPAHPNPSTQTRFGWATGGLVGYAAGTMISDSSASGVVTGSGLGLVGIDPDRPGTGGLVGSASNDSAIINSRAIGDVTAGFLVGGLVGNAYINVTIEDSTADGNVTAQSTAGGLVGRARNNVVISGCSASGTITGNSDHLGGLVGYAINGISISNCSANGDVTNRIEFTGGLVGRVESSFTISNSFATGDVTGSRTVGGLVGFAASGGTIESSYATGNIVGRDFSGGLIGSVNFLTTGPQPIPRTGEVTIDNSFAIGTVNGRSGNYVGGLIGISFDMTLSDSFATGVVSSGDRFVGGLIGDANVDSTISRTFAANSVTGNADVGAFVGYSDGATYVGNYFANDRNTPSLPGIGTIFGTGNSGAVDEVTGDSLTNLQAVVGTGGPLFTSWGSEWDFGTANQLPGLLIDGDFFRDGDADGALD